MKGALLEMWNGYVVNGSGRVVFLEFLYQIFKSRLALTDSKQLFLEVGESLLSVFDLSEGLPTAFDSAVQVVHLVASNRADRWEVTATRTKVRLDPPKGDIGPAELETFTAVVPAATGSADVFTYHWSTSGAHGHLVDTNHSGNDFDSSSSSVVYEPDRVSFGKDTVTVEVFAVDGQARTSVGSASAEIIVREVVPTIVPHRAYLLKGEQQSFAARVPGVAGGALSYRWFGTSKFGHLSGVTDNIETSSDHASYVATAGEGEDTVAVEVFVSARGQKRSLGIARAQVKTELKRSVVFGSYQTRVDQLPEGFVHVYASFSIPKVAGATSYSVHCYGFNDFAYYGPEAHFGPSPEPIPGVLVDGDAYVIDLAGGTGPAENTDVSVAGYEARFAGMIVEVTITY